MTVFCLAFATLLYEIVLTRVFAYFLPFQVTPLALSMAMLGLGLGAWLRAAAPEGRWRSSSALAALAASWLLLVAALYVRWDFWTLTAAALPPFLALGALLAEAYAAAPSAHGAYLRDLAGGSAACLAATSLLVRWSPLGALLALAAAAGAASLAGPGRRAARAAVAAAAAAPLAAWAAGLVPDPAAAPKAGASKPLYEALRRDGGRVVDSAWGEAGRADLYEDPAFENLKWLYNDATNSSYLVRDPDTPARKAFLSGLLLNAPTALFHPRRVLVLGSGGGIEVRLARLGGAAEVDAVEVNRSALSLVRRWKEFAGDVYDAPGVRAHAEEGRRFLASAPGTYDLIQMSLAFSATALSGTFALAEGHLHTVEAYRLYLERLSPGGVLAVFDDTGNRALRGFLTAAAALEERGLPPAEALRRLAVVGNPGVDGTGYAFMVLASREPFSDAALDGLARLCRERGFTPLWVPGRAAGPPFGALASVGRKAFVERHALDLRPRRDDSPYFFYFGRGWRAHLATLAPVVAMGLLALGGGLAAVGASALPRRPAALAAACGLAFMLVEAGLLQCLTLTTRGPTELLTSLLFSLLLWCGLGGRLAQAGGLRLAPRFAAAGATVAVWTGLFGGGVLASIQGTAWRAAAVFFALAPLGLALGGPFPTLLESQAGLGPRYRAFLWSVNGLASVAGACLATCVSFVFGTQACLWAGATAYALASLIAVQFGPSRPD